MHHVLVCQAQLTARGPAGACTELLFLLPSPPPDSSTSSSAECISHTRPDPPTLHEPPASAITAPTFSTTTTLAWPQCAAGFLLVCVEGGIVGAGAGGSGGSPCATTQCLGDLMQKRILTRTCMMGTCGPALPNTPPTFLILFCPSLYSQRALCFGMLDKYWLYPIIMTHAEIDRTFNDTA